MIRIELTSDNTATVHTETGAHTITAGAAGLQQAVIDHLITVATEAGAPVTAELDDSPVSWLRVTPDGAVDVIDTDPAPTTEPADPAPVAPAETIPEAAPVIVEDEPQPRPTMNPFVQAAPAGQQRPAETPTVTRRSLRETTFLATEQASAPATQGWRGTLNKLGLRLEPSTEETAERDDVRTVSQHWPGPRTVAVVNRKGGANKTPTVVLLSAVLARYGGGPVIAWDNNESQGTLGWRTEQGPHARSVLDLMDASDQLLAPTANAADLAHHVHHQTTDKFDVLRSDENDEGDHEITAEEVDLVHRVVSKYYRLIVMDSGNTARSANWRRMIDHTNQLVVPVTAMEDRAEAALLTLQTLEARGGHDAELARNAVVIVSESTDSARGFSRDAVNQGKQEAARIAEGFAPLVRDVVRVPYDPALVRGHIQFDALRPATQRAWLAAAAAVARGF